LTLAAARIWARRGRAALAALGAAAAAALLATVLAAGVAVEDATVQRELAQTPQAERAVRASWGGIPTDPSERFAVLDDHVHRAVRDVSGRDATAFMLYREWRIRGDLVDLGGGDNLRSWVALHSGRYPAPCRPDRCEIVQLAGTGRLPSVPGLRLVRVGTGSLRSAAPLADLVSADTSSSILAQSQRYHRPPMPPFVLAEGVDALSRIRYLEDDYRSYAWVVPLEAGAVRSWDVDGFRTHVAAARATLGGESPLFALTAPEEQLAAAAETGKAGSRRLLLLGGEAAALLLAFGVLTAAGLRRDAEIGRRRLTWLGARRWQLALEAVAETALIGAAGVVIGWFLGLLPAALVSRHLSAPAGPVLEHSVLTGGGLAVGCALAIAGAVVLLAALWTPPLRLGGWAISVLDVAALGAAVAAAVLLARGSADASTLAGGNGTGAALLLLPALIAFVAAVVAARVVGFLPRLLERGARRASIATRLAFLSVARSPGRAAAAVAFLVVSLGLGLFALVYRSTLVASQRDEANFAFPRSVVVREDYSQLVPVLQAAPPARYRALGDAAQAIRQSGNVPGLEGSGFTLLGVPPATMATFRGWRSDFSADSLATLARRIESPRDIQLRGAAIPVGATRLTVPARVRANVAVRAQVETGDGRFLGLPLQARGPRSLETRLPAGGGGGKLLGFAFEPHNVRLSLGANGVRAGKSGHGGTVVFGVPRVTTSAGTKPLHLDYGSWTGTGGVRARNGARRVELQFLVTPELVARFRPRQPLDGVALPVIASTRVAAAAGAGGLLPLDLEGHRLLTRVVGSAARFPSIDGDFVLGDGRALATALNTIQPGAATTNELWLEPRRGQDERKLLQTLSQPPFAVLDVQSRAALEQRLSSDPLARGSLLALTAAALVAAALALAGLLFDLIAELRDERGELFDLEAQGVTPTLLRRRLRLRSAFVVAVGALGGLATAAVLSALVVELVKLTANATAPEPPLVLSVDWWLVAVAAGAYVVAAVALAVAVSRGAFRAPSAGRVAEATW